MLERKNKVKCVAEEYEETIPAKCMKTYMSIISLTRTLTATSIDGFPPWVFNLDDTVMTLTFGEDISEQTAAITSHTSAGFSRKGCCSLFKQNNLGVNN